MSAPKTEKIGRNAPCPCGSGRKYKACHLGEEHDLALGPLQGAVTELELDAEKFQKSTGLKVQSFTATAVLQSEVDNKMPFWFADLAGDAALGTTTRAEGRAGVVKTILLTVLAGEALVNRLLEPLSGKAWHEIERESAAKKWVRLSRTIKMKPELTKVDGPLKAFAELVELRNELVHYKFVKNMRVAQYELPSDQQGFKTTIRFPNKPSVRLPVVKDTGLEDSLAPDRAWPYFRTLVDVMAAVGTAYPEDRFETRKDLLDFVRLAKSIETTRSQ